MMRALRAWKQLTALGMKKGVGDQNYLKVSQSFLKYASSDGYLKGIIKVGVCEVGGVPNELPAFQRLERYPRVLGRD